jgi:hypothetical protein
VGIDHLRRIGFLLAVLIPMAVLGCGPARTTGVADSRPGTVVSPDGRWSVVTSINGNKPSDPCIQLEIRDASGGVVHREQTGESDRMRWEFAWDDEDRLWLYSGDIGTFYWERRDGIWTRSAVAARARSGDPLLVPPERILDHERRVGHR